MKTFLLVFASASLAGAPLMAAPSPSAPASAAVPAPRSSLTVPTVALTVSVPPSLQAFHDDDIANAVADTVLSEFRRDGFRGQFDYDFTEPGRVTARLPRLELSLIEWRVTPTRFVECTLAADLITADGTTSLGLFSGTSILDGWIHDPFSRADDFDDAARGAIDDLYRALAAKNLLPDVIKGV